MKNEKSATINCFIRLKKKKIKIKIISVFFGCFTYLSTFSECDLMIFLWFFFSTLTAQYHEIIQKERDLINFFLLSGQVTLWVHNLISWINEIFIILFIAVHDDWAGLKNWYFISVSLNRHMNIPDWIC